MILSASSSVADKLTETDWSSAIVWSGIDARTGASLIEITVIVKVTVLELTVPSLAVTLIIPDPLKLDEGVRVNSEPVIDIAISSVLLTAEYVNKSPSTSEAESDTAKGVSSAVV